MTSTASEEPSVKKSKFEFIDAVDEADPNLAVAGIVKETQRHTLSFFKMNSAGKFVFFGGRCPVCKIPNVALVNDSITDNNNYYCCPNAILQCNGTATGKLKSNACCSILYEINSLKRVQSYKPANPLREFDVEPECTRHLLSKGGNILQKRLLAMDINLFDDTQEVVKSYNQYIKIISSNAYGNALHPKHKEAVEAGSKMDVIVQSMIQTLQIKDLDSRRSTPKIEIGRITQKKGQNTKATALSNLNAEMVLFGCETKGSFWCHRFAMKCCIFNCGGIRPVERMSDRNVDLLYCTINGELVVKTKSFEQSKHGKLKKLPDEALSEEYVKKNVLPLDYIKGLQLEEVVSLNELQFSQKLANYTPTDHAAGFDINDMTVPIVDIDDFE